VKRTLKNYRLTFLWALFIFMMCTIKIGKIEQSSIFFPGFDKLVHCGFFLVFVVFFANDIIRQHNYTFLPFKYAILVFVTAIIYGGSIELLQWLVFTWRDGDWNDLFADTIGAGMGMYSVLITAAALNNDKK